MQLLCSFKHKMFVFLDSFYLQCDGFSIHDRGLLREHDFLSALKTYPSGHAHCSEPLALMTHVGGHSSPGLHFWFIAENE